MFSGAEKGLKTNLISTVKTSYTQILCRKSHAYSYIIHNSKTRALKCKTLGGIHMQSTAAMHIH